MKRFYSKQKGHYISLIVIYLALIIFCLIINKLDFEVLLALTLGVLFFHLISINELQYIIDIDEDKIKITTEFILFPQKNIEIQYDEINKMTVKRGGKGSGTIWFKIHCKNGKIEKFKLLNSFETIEELIQLIKQKNILVEKKY